jgi:hypothetical protein
MIQNKLAGRTNDSTREIMIQTVLPGKESAKWHLSCEKIMEKLWGQVFNLLK